MCSIVYVIGYKRRQLRIMKTLGDTIKAIRKQKKLTQKEVYMGIVSRNFASRFENGHNSVESEKLFAILKRLEVSPNEFQFIHYNNSEYRFNSILNQIDSDANMKKTATLMQKHIALKKDPSLESQILAAIAYIKVYIIGNNPLRMDVDPAYPLKRHLTETKYWSVFELRAFVDGIFIFRKDPVKLRECMTKVHDLYKKYKEFTEYSYIIEQSVATIVLNYVQIELTNFNYDSNSFRKITDNSYYSAITDFTAKLTMDFARLVIFLYLGSDQKNDEANCYEFIHMLKVLQHNDYIVFNEIYHYHLPLSQRYRKSQCS